MSTKHVSETKPEQLELVEPRDPILNLAAQELNSGEIGSAYIQSVIKRMLELAAGKGQSTQDSRQMVGLAAVQLGVRLRIILVDLTADGSFKQQHLQVLINPRISHRSKETVPDREGCWSCGNICGKVQRAKDITVEGLDQGGNIVRFELTGFVARIVQHETDHLDGVRFPDRIPVNEPERLHIVQPTEFAQYRLNWEHWPTLCPRQLWEEMKGGSSTPRSTASKNI